MKGTTRFIHQIIKTLRLDSFFAFAGRFFFVLNKFIPLPQEYAVEEYRSVARNGVRYRLTVSDYMQWSIYANQQDNSWRYAARGRQSGAVILDIGANAGQFCLKVAHQLSHAFEPNHTVYSTLSHNLSLNSHIKEHLQLHNLAVGDSNSQMFFTFNRSNTGGGVISMEASNYRVSMVKLDDWFSNNKLQRLDFIKIDVEGYEPQVLLGGEKVIQQFKPDLFLEITDEWFKKEGFSADWVFNLLQTWGYQWSIDGYGEQKEINEAFLSNIHPHQFNILATVKRLPD
jgi:FkbM family methyltransferase